MPNHWPSEFAPGAVENTGDQLIIVCLCLFSALKYRLAVKAIGMLFSYLRSSNVRNGSCMLEVLFGVRVKYWHNMIQVGGKRTVLVKILNSNGFIKIGADRTDIRHSIQ
jgi:hypothetical protein